MERWKNKRKKAVSHGLPTWNYESGQMLWMIKISDDDLILVEERNPEARTASFACVRCVDGAVLWSDLRFDEPWWISLADMFDGIAYFQSLEYRKFELKCPA